MSRDFSKIVSGKIIVDCGVKKYVHMKYQFVLQWLAKFTKLMKCVSLCKFSVIGLHLHLLEH